MDDNVIDLPTSRTEDNTTEPAAPVVENLEDQLEKRSEKSAEFMVDLMDKQRKEGLELLLKKLEGLSSSREVLDDAKAENVTRFLGQGLGASSQTLQALSALIDVLVHDVGVTVQNIHRHAMGLEQISTHLQALMNLALEKGIVTEEEMREEVGKVLNPEPPTSPEKEDESVTEEV